MVFNTIIIENVSSPLTVIQGANTLTGGALGVFIIFLIQLVLFAGFKYAGTDTRASILAVAFISIIISSLLWAVGFLSFYILTYPMLTLIGSILYYFISPP